MANKIPVRVQKSKNRKVISKEEEAFCNHILGGKLTYAEAVVEAGILEGDLSDDKFKTKAKKKAQQLMRTTRCEDYIRANKKTAVVYTPNDLDKLNTHMFEIAMGRATMTVDKVVDGELVTVEERPSFKDQIAAATWVKAMTKDMMSSARFKKAELKADEIIDAKAKAFLDKWKTRDVETKGPADYRNGKRAIVENLIDDADYEEALDADQSEYRL